MYKALYGELKEDDIKFGEGEQRFFRAIFEIFSQSEDINNLKKKTAFLKDAYLAANNTIYQNDFSIYDTKIHCF